MIPFHETRIGARFLEHTLPELVRQLKRLADAVERIADSRQPQSKETEDDHQD
jgi:hypothetical protein